MTLTPEERNILVNNRVAKAHQALHEAKGTAQMQFWNTAINRLYYAVYNMASALLIKNGYNAQTHAGVARLLAQYYVKTGIIPEEVGKNYNRLFDLRQTGDYDDWRTIEEEDVTKMLEPAEMFIQTIEELIKEQ